MPPAFDPQAALQQVVQRLDGLQAAQNQTQQILLQTVGIPTATLHELRQTQATQAEMQADSRQLRDSHLMLLKVQNNMLDFMKFTLDKQTKWNERQDQFNIIFLDKLRDFRREGRRHDSEAKSARDKLYKELKDRLNRLEDFMNDQLRKAS